MKTYIVLLAVLSVSGIAWAADAPSVPPNAPMPGVSEPPPPSQGEGMRHGHERMMPERGEIRERLAERHEEYIKWLEKNYPQEAKELVQVKEDDPNRYLVRLKESFEKYGRLAHADKKNPELAKLLREDIGLKTQIEKKIADIHAATDEKQKQKLTGELQQLVSKRFDLIVAQKQIRYQELNRKLEELKKEIKKHESDLDKLKSKKDEEVKNRVDELVNQTEEIRWD